MYVWTEGREGDSVCLRILYRACTFEFVLHFVKCNQIQIIIIIIIITEVSVIRTT